MVTSVASLSTLIDNCLIAIELVDSFTTPGVSVVIFAKVCFELAVTAAPPPPPLDVVVLLESLLELHDELPPTVADAEPVVPPRSKVIVLLPVKHVECFISKVSVFVLDALIVVPDDEAGSPLLRVNPDGKFNAYVDDTSLA